MNNVEEEEDPHS